MGFLKPSKPKVEKREVQPLPPAPTLDEAAREVEVRDQRRLNRRGRAATILTGESGLGGQLGGAGAPQARAGAGAKILLGQGA